MIWDIPTLLDFVGSLAIIALLSVAYGGLRARLPGEKLAPSILGLAFGAVAILQMHAPLEPIEGLIVDMRNVPMVLAGAFLGLRGLVLCLVIGIAFRLGIGGVGVWAGIGAMLIAGGVGAFWRATTLGQHRRKGRTIVSLGVMANLHMVAAVLLPMDVAVFFLTEAGPVLVGLNLLAIPIVATLLERERILIESGARQRAAALKEDGRAFVPREALGWTLAQAAAIGNLQGKVTVIRLQVCPTGLLALLGGRDVCSWAVASLRESILKTVPDAGVVGRLGPNRLLIVMPDYGDSGIELEAKLRYLANAPIEIPGMVPVPVTISTRRTNHSSLPAIPALLGAAPRRRGFRRPVPVAEPEPGQGTERLFEVMQRLEDARRDARFNTLREANGG